jgi:hypothetical protein
MKKTTNEANTLVINIRKRILSVPWFIVTHWISLSLSMILQGVLQDSLSFIPDKDEDVRGR